MLVQVEQRVEVDLSGLNLPGISFGRGVKATGVVRAVDASSEAITVCLDRPYRGGLKTLVLAPDRIAPDEPELPVGSEPRPG